MKQALVVILVVLACAACGGSGHGKFVDDKINDNYSEVKLPYKGSYIFCLRSHFSVGDGGNTRSDWGGLSCDWVEFHRRTES